MLKGMVWLSIPFTVLGLSWPSFPLSVTQARLGTQVILMSQITLHCLLSGILCKDVWWVVWTIHSLTHSKRHNVSRFELKFFMRRKNLQYKLQPVVQAHGTGRWIRHDLLTHFQMIEPPPRSLVSRPLPAFRHLQYGKAGRARYLFSHEHDTLVKFCRTNRLRFAYFQLTTHSTLSV